VGQLFIFYTIKRYGPLVFATIQTVRQLGVGVREDGRRSGRKVALTPSLLRRT
tara:strand:+ start:52 stop:210 length:159 start_codon:yes stop_codon:yes gene_type:complete